MKYSAVIVAAGSGSRMGLGYNKVYAKLEGDQTILETTLQPFIEDEECTQIIVVTNPSEYRQYITSRMIGKILLSTGGATRQDSVYQGLQAVKEDIVMIHDGARPYITSHELNELKDAMKYEKSACLCVPCVDTIKKVNDGYIVGTPNRTTMYAAQTPQVFQTDLILKCAKKAKETQYVGTDDCSLVEKYTNVPIKVVIGNYKNIKITTINDLNQ